MAEGGGEGAASGGSFEQRPRASTATASTRGTRAEQRPGEGLAPGRTPGLAEGTGAASKGGAHLDLSAAAGGGHSSGGPAQANGLDTGPREPFPPSADRLPLRQLRNEALFRQDNSNRELAAETECHGRAAIQAQPPGMWQKDSVDRKRAAAGLPAADGEGSLAKGKIRGAQREKKGGRGAGGAAVRRDEGGGVDLLIDLPGPVSGGGYKRASGGSRSGGGAAAADAKKPRAASGCSPEASYSERLDFTDPEVSAPACSLQACKPPVNPRRMLHFQAELCLKSNCLKYLPGRSV